MIVDPARLVLEASPGAPVAGYRFAFGCGDCGGPLDHGIDGKTTPSSSTAAATCRCCGSAWLVRVEVLRIGNPPGRRAGRPRTGVAR